jgi:hypothetical protein
MPYTKALIPLGLFLAGVLLGWSWTGARWDADVAEIRLDLATAKLNATFDARSIERLQVVADNALDAAAAASGVEHETRVQYVTKEVVKYVESPDAGKCSYPPSWVRAYNAGWSGGSGLPSAEISPIVVDDAAAGVRADAGKVDGRPAAAGSGAEQPQPPQDARHAAKAAGVGAGGNE